MQQSTHALAVQAISCSPRAGGNSDQAMRLFAKGVEEAGAAVSMHTLRSYTITPCVACGRCEHDPRGWCYLSGGDQSEEVFRLLLEAPALFFSAPVYFYHVPTLFKAFIDRGQSYWIRRAKRDPMMTDLPKRKAFLSMVAARNTGENLFKGSILTLKYFLQPFNIELEEPLLFYGIDGPKDLAHNPQAAERLLTAGHEAAVYYKASTK